MSCNLKQTCSIKDIAAVRKFLFPVTHGDEEIELHEERNEDWDAESWMDTWGEGNTEHTEDEVKDTDENEAWLNNCHLGFSPTYDLVAIACHDKLVLLSAKSETTTASRSSSSRRYKISAQIEVTDETSEQVTSLLCIPLVSLKRTSHGSVDWSCVVLGFSSGYVKMYTETGALLVSQLFHESPVLELKCRTHDMGSARNNVGPEQTDEVTALYGDALVVLDGFSLFQTLRACRSQVALAAASGGMTIEPPPMSFKKWRLTGGQSNISCHVSPGVLTPNPFDHMRTASILGGYAAEIRGTAPAMSCYVATGSTPFTGYYYAIEGSSQPHLSHVALAVASKLKSALYNQASRWLAWGSGSQQDASQSQRPKPKVELGTPLDIRCGLPDPLRQGDNIILAPGACLASSALAVTTDSFGRVILMDIARGVALRMWKGYRDAQVGFMRVFDDAHRAHHRHRRGHTDGPTHHDDENGPRKHALFLLLYAPRRGLLEVWTCVNGPRVGAFNVSKNARLLFPGHGMMGLSNSTIPSTTSHTYQCCLVEPGGQVKEIRIPFHLALSDANSKKARDMHLLKKLNLLLHSRKRTGEEATKILLEIRISAMLKQALEKLLHTRKIGPDTFRHCISAIQDRLKEGGAIKKEDNDLLKYCEAQMNLIDLYEALVKLNASGISDCDAVVSDIENVTNIDEMWKLLHVTRSEATESLAAVARFVSSRHKPQVRFEAEENPSSSLDVAEFLDCFALNDISTTSVPPESSPPSRNVRLNLTDPMKTTKFAQFLFHASLFGSTAPDDVMFTLEGGIDLDSRTIPDLVFQQWLQQDAAITNNLANSIGKLYIFVETANRRNHRPGNDPGTRSPDESHDLWSWIRDEICAPSHNAVASYFLAVVARAVAISAKSDPNKEAKETSEDDGEDSWEKMQMQDAEEEEPPPSYDDSCTGETVVESRTRFSGGEWETLWIDTEKWNLFVRQLEDCLLISTAINLGQKRPGLISREEVNKKEVNDKAIESSDVVAREKVSVKDLLSNGPGFIAELITHAICQLQIEPRLLSPRHDDESYSFSDVSQEQKEFLDFLHVTLYPKFPYSLSPDCIHAHCFWELTVSWNKEPLEVPKLQRAIEHLGLVRHDPYARHGLSVMAWKTFIAKRYIALAKLIDKVGKAPKDRLCRKDVGISDVLVSSFCQACTDVLQTIADADLDSVPGPSEDDALDVPMGAEDAWQGVTGRRSIVDMGRAHSHAHYGLVQHNMHLCFVLHATMQFTLRGVKPLSTLFDKRGNSCFAVDLTTKDPLLPIPDSMDLAVSRARQQFLSKVVTAAIERLAAQLSSTGDSTPQISRRECREESEKWVETSVHMASEFQIDVEQVKISHVCELFKNGLDDIGQEACTTVSDKDVLSSTLVIIVGQRLSYLLLHAKPDDGVVMLARMPPTLSTWIKSQDSNLLKKPDVPISDTLKLARLVLTMMSENHSQYNIALYLEEAASAMLSP